MLIGINFISIVDHVCSTSQLLKELPTPRTTNAWPIKTLIKLSKQLSNYQNRLSTKLSTIKIVIKKTIKKLCFLSSITAFAWIRKTKTELVWWQCILSHQKLRDFLRTFPATDFCGRWECYQNRCVHLSNVEYHI